MLTDSRRAPTRDRSSLRIALASLLCLLMSGCYVMQAAHGEYDVLEKRRPIEKVVADPQTPPKLRSTLEQVENARDFATRELGLPNNKSYRTYSDIGRPFVVWNVVAAPEFSVEPLRWCFPFVGCVDYRGYYKERSARRFAAKLKSHGYDVTVDGVPAYSTLGHFADPVLSSMLPYGDVELAGIIFHELTHQLLYVPGDTSFNEAFAVTMEQEGVRRWLLQQGRTADLKRYEEENRLDLEYVALFRDYRARLQRLYASALPRWQMRESKRATFASLAEDMRALGRRTHTSAYRDWLAEGLNNADLASVATYYDCVPGFQRLLRENDGDLQRFYADVRALARKPAVERDAAVCTNVSAARSPRETD